MELGQIIKPKDMSRKLLEKYRSSLVNFHIEGENAGVVYIGTAEGVAYFIIRDHGAGTTLGLKEGQRTLKTLKRKEK